MTQMPSWMPDQPDGEPSPGSRRRMMLFGAVAIAAVVFAVSIGVSLIFNAGPAAHSVETPRPTFTAPPFVYDTNAILNRTFACDSIRGDAFALSFDATKSIYTVKSEGEETGTFTVGSDPTVIEYASGPLAGTTSKANANLSRPRLRFSGVASAFPAGTDARCLAD